MGKLGIVKMVTVTFAAVSGLSYQQFVGIFGVNINKNTWTQYVNDVGMVCAEALERNRRNIDKRYKYAMWDETAFGKRKYHRGSRRRKCDIQWGLTCVEVDPVTNKTLAVDLQFLPYNKRTAKVITPLVFQRMVPGGSMHAITNQISLV